MIRSLVFTALLDTSQEFGKLRVEDSTQVITAAVEFVEAARTAQSRASVWQLVRDWVDEGGVTDWIDVNVKADR